MSDSAGEPEQTPWVMHLYTILPNIERTAILLLPTDEGWMLPNVHAGNDIWVSDAGHIVAELRQQLGWDFAFTVLRYMSHEPDEATRSSQTIFVLESHQLLVDPPSGGVWVDHQELATLPLALPEQRSALLAYVAELVEGAVPARRAPWARVGWFAAAAAWIEEQLVRLGYEQSGPVEQLRNWSISCVLRVPTTRGEIYFKAAADLPLFVNEPALLAKLVEIFPHHIPAPLAIDAERCWVLLADFGPALRDQGEHDLAPVLSLYGQMQCQAAHYLDELLAAGAHDRQLAVLLTQIERLVSHPLSQSVLEPAEWEVLQGMAAHFTRLCMQLAEYNLPATLLHGDLHMGNVALQDGDYLFFDWTDGCVGHPFFDMLHAYFYESSEPEKVRLRDTYLAAWSAYESPQRLLEAWEVVKHVTALHHAVSYLHIVENLEPLVQAELSDGLRDFLRYMLKSADMPSLTSV